MKRQQMIVIGWLTLGCGLGFFVWKKNSIEEPAAAAITTARPISHVESNAGSRAAASKAAANAGVIIDHTREPVISSETRRESSAETIQTAIVTYAPEGVNPIAAFLLDSDPEIRESAREGLKQLGEAAAIPLLRSAAQQLTNMDEAKACEEAAAFLELPSWSLSEDARAVAEENAHPAPAPAPPTPEQ
jgi:HEAT repeat protein